MPNTQALRDMLDKAHEEKPLKTVVTLSPAALQGVSDADAEALKKAFNINTIADLATNKYVRWAQALVTMAEVEK